MIHFIQASLTKGAEIWLCITTCTRDHSIRYYEGEGIKVNYVTIRISYIHIRDLPGHALAITFFMHGDFSAKLQQTLLSLSHSNFCV